MILLKQITVYGVETRIISVTVSANSTEDGLRIIDNQYFNFNINDLYSRFEVEIHDQNITWERAFDEDE